MLFNAGREVPWEERILSHMRERRRRIIQRVIMFLASPGDLAEEREVVRATVDELNRNWSDHFAVELQVIGWEEVPSGTGREGQEVINSYINDDYDIFLGLMGSRRGSPTRGASSGTVEEYERALERFRLNPEAVEIMFYAKQFPSPRERQSEASLVAAFLGTTPGGWGAVRAF